MDSSQGNTEEKVLREIEIVIPLGKTPERLDVFLARQVADLTRSQAEQAIESGNVTVNGRLVKPAYKIKGGEMVKVIFLARPPLELRPEPIPLNIVYEDEWLMVIDKPAGMVVHPAKGNRAGTLVNAVLSHYEQLTPALDNDPDRPGIVHRLDKETSGLIVVCKREPAMSRLSEQFRAHSIEREYRAIVWWNFPSKQGLIDAPIGRDPKDRHKYAVRFGSTNGIDKGKPARTHWFQLEKFDFLSYLALKLETGRTHQIRVHLSYIGHPVFGDPEYGGRNRQIGKLSSAQRVVVGEYLEVAKRQMLHAAILGFKHPITNSNLHFESPLPNDFYELLSMLRKSKN